MIARSAETTRERGLVASPLYRLPSVVITLRVMYALTRSVRSTLFRPTTARVLTICMLSAPLLTVVECTAQQLIEGTRGARLIQWPMNGRIASMAVSDDGSVVVGGLTAVDLGAGQVGFAPILWSVEQTGGVQPTILPTLTASSASNTGWVNAISRNAQWAGGWTPSAEVAAGTLWEVSNPAMPDDIGLTVAGTGPPQVAFGSSVVAVSDLGAAFGVGVETGTAKDYGFVQRPGEEHAIMLPTFSNAPGVAGNLHPASVSRDGETVVGQVPFANDNYHAGLWRNGEEFAQPLFQDDIASRAFAIAPNGRYAGGDIIFGEDPLSRRLSGFTMDLQSEEVTLLVDEFGLHWPMPVIDVSDDGRVAVGDANVLLDYTEYSSDVGFIAVDGVAQNFTDWLADRFSLQGLSFEVVRSVYRHQDRYHFVAQSGNNASWAGTGYYISIPVSSTFAPAIAGDFSGDGVVDAADYVLWRDQLGANYTPADYEAWRTNFGHSAAIGADAPSAAVPEPTSIVLVAVALAVLLRAMRQRFK
jgi:hypothetical protein